MCGNDVLPLQTMRSFIISFWSIVVTRGYFFVGIEWAAAIEGCPVIMVNLSFKEFFGFAEGLIGCVAVVGSVARPGEQEDNSQAYYKGCEFFR